MKILVCSDCSEAGEYVLNEAQKFIANLANAEVHVFSAIDMSVVAVAGMYDNTEEVKSLQLQAGEVNKWAEKIFAGQEINFASELGNPVEVILQQAARIKADLIIMGTAGKSGLNRMFLGSVAESVLRQTTRNMLIIPVKHVKHG